MYGKEKINNKMIVIKHTSCGQLRHPADLMFQSKYGSKWKTFIWLKYIFQCINFKSGSFKGLCLDPRHDYDFTQHVASDVGIDQQYLAPDRYSAQNTLNFVSNWTHENLMKLNEKKCKYMVFFVTRLQVNNIYLERVPT